MTQTEQRLLNYLKIHKRITALGALKSLGITDLKTVVCSIRKKYGFKVLKTGHVRVLTASGSHYFNMPEYTLTTEGEAKIWPVKKKFPQWVTAYQKQRV